MESHFLRKFSGIEKKLTHGATLLLASLEEAKLGCFATSLAPLETKFCEFIWYLIFAQLKWNFYNRMLARSKLDFCWAHVVLL